MDIRAQSLLMHRKCIAIGDCCLYFQISESNFGMEHQLASE